MFSMKMTFLQEEFLKIQMLEGKMVEKSWALFESRNGQRKCRKLRAEGGHSSISGRENEPVWSKISPEPEGEETM